MPQEPIIERREYLRALEREWPEVIDDFEINVLSRYIPPLFKRRKNGSQLAGADSLSLLKSDRSRSDLLGAIEQWAERYGLMEDWILEAVVATGWRDQGIESVSGKTRKPQVAKRVDEDDAFCYSPSVIFETPFESKFTNAAWLPLDWGGNEIWPDFRRRITSEFDKQLKAYGAVFGIDRPHISRDAVWTVRYQRGDSAFEISKELAGYSDAEQTAYRAITRFANTIGVRLRRNKRRR